MTESVQRQWKFIVIKQTLYERLVTLCCFVLWRYIVCLCIVCLLLEDVMVSNVLWCTMSWWNCACIKQLNTCETVLFVQRRCMVFLLLETLQECVMYLLFHSDSNRKTSWPVGQKVLCWRIWQCIELYFSSNHEHSMNSGFVTGWHYVHFFFLVKNSEWSNRSWRSSIISNKSEIHRTIHGTIGENFIKVSS